MCRGENVQCKECCRLSSRIVELCIRGELMATCPETIIEGVSLEKEVCRLCRYGNIKGKVVIPPSVLALSNEHDRNTWRASKAQPIPRPVYRPRRLKYQSDPSSCCSSESKGDLSWPSSFADLQWIRQTLDSRTASFMLRKLITCMTECESITIGLDHIPLRNRSRDSMCWWYPEESLTLQLWRSDGLIHFGHWAHYWSNRYLELSSSNQNQSTNINRVVGTLVPLQYVPCIIEPQLDLWSC